MSAIIFNGSVLAKKIKENIIKDVKKLEKNKQTPNLQIIQVGQDSAVDVFFQSVQKSCLQVGISSEISFFPETVSQDTLLKKINYFNHSDAVNGILLGLPLPYQLNKHIILNEISPIKDVDCMTSKNQGGIIFNTNLFNNACCLAVLKIIAQLDIDVTGKHIVIVGDSLGKLIALNFLKTQATITLCNKYTTALSAHVKSADILISAVGEPRLIHGSWIKPQSIILDIGIHCLEDGSIIGDIDVQSAKNHAKLITAVPRGIGPVTIMMLLSNIVRAAHLQAEIR